MLDQLVPPSLIAIDRSVNCVGRAEDAYHRSVLDHSFYLIEIADRILAAWHRECEKVLKGDTLLPNPADTRNHIGSIIEALRVGLEMFRQASPLARESRPHLERLQGAIGKLERLHARLMRWHTPEDLEDIAAEELAPTAEQLDAVAAKYGFPQAWYDEDGKPF